MIRLSKGCVIIIQSGPRPPGSRERAVERNPTLMHNFPRPGQTRLYAERTAVDVSCPSCGSPGSVASYPVLSEGGWWDVVKCRDCLYTLERNRTSRLGQFSPRVAVGTSVHGAQKGK